MSPTPKLLPRTVQDIYNVKRKPMSFDEIRKTFRDIQEGDSYKRLCADLADIRRLTAEDLSVIVQG